MTQEEPSFFTKMHNAFVSQLTSGNLRRGQSWMNALREVDFARYVEVSGTDADCFYDDRKIDAFKREVFGIGGT